MTFNKLPANLWRGAASVNYGDQSFQFPLTNFAGRNFPSVFPSMMTQVLGIQPADRVLDVGGGDEPYERADVIADPFLEESVHRSGRAVRPGFEYVKAFAEDLPFNDGEFDFVWCRHVLEHSTDPAKACSEMQRVGKRGFIETPSPFSECCNQNPTHRWLVWVENETLVFRPRPFRLAPLRHIISALWYSDVDFRSLYEVKLRNITNTQFYWEDQLACRVEERTPEDYDCDDPVQAAEANLDMAINGLSLGAAPPQISRPHAEEALRLKPEWALAHNVRGCCLWREGNREEAMREFMEAHRLEPKNAVFAANSRNSTDNPEIGNLPGVASIGSEQSEGWFSRNFMLMLDSRGRL